MDDRVIRAMAKWPNVPAVYGWLSLDRRGRWRLRGSPITHPGAVKFIARNYLDDGRGRWFFQNGPQRVYVDLDYTPWVYALRGDGTLGTHTGLSGGALNGVWLDENGALLLALEPGVGVLDDRDLGSFAGHLRDADGRVVEHIETGPDARNEGLWLQWNGRRIAVVPIQSAAVPGRFGFVARPRAVN